MIDWNQVAELRDAVGGDEFDELVEVFLDEVEGVISNLGPGSVGELESQLHFLKGSALNLGFSDLSDLCQQGETEARLGNGAAVDLPKIVRSYETSKDVFLAEVKTRFAA